MSADLVCLFGNGLSIELNEHLRLGELTSSFLERHSEDRDAIARLTGTVELEGRDPDWDFEAVVGAIESAEEVLDAFMTLAMNARLPELKEAANLLEGQGIPALARRLYYSYCAEVLSTIGELTRVAVPKSILTFGDWLKALYEVHAQTTVFTLNYDVMMERLLVADDLLQLRPAVTDFFSGLPERTAEIQLYEAGPSTRSWLFWPSDPPPRRLHLHHLHGCLSHIRDERDGTILKIEAGAARDLDFYPALAGGALSHYRPSIILGSRKIEKSREWPFSFAFLSLEEDLKEARTVVIGGYSFRDAAVNTRLSLAGKRERRWIVIDHKVGDEAQTEFRSHVVEVLGVEPEFVFGGFGSELPEVA